MSGFPIAGTAVPRGERRRVELPAARLVTGTPLSLPVEVLHGREPGPCVWLSGAVHGDEIVGVEIIRRVVEKLRVDQLSGTLLSVPIVNVFGFIAESRYLPDRRDLNRSFPGSAKGSLASRLAHLFMEEVVRKSDLGIDFHAGSDDRTNLPQIRADLDDDPTREMARAFGAPVTLDARLRDGSLRHAASEEGIPILLFEGGEARRFGRRAIEAGVAGTLRVLGHLGMCEPDVADAPPTVESRKSRWIRASRSGILRLDVQAGDRVSDGDVLGAIRDSFGDRKARVQAGMSGVVVGHTLNPLVNRGDGLVHLAATEAG